MKNVAIRIHGRVQGVGFRYHAQKMAREHNISGMIKNMIDGTVYIEASGTETAIESFINWCYNGPRWAHVEKVDVSDITDKGYDNFSINR